MSAFRELRDVSNNFEYDLRLTSAELFSAKIGYVFEDTIAKKTKDLALFSSKLKLLKAKTIPSLQVPERTDENVLEEYGDTAVWKVVEQVTAKTLTQAHAVKALITAPNSSLDAELVERKEAIIDSLEQFRNSESQLRHLNTLLKDKEAEHAAVRAQWDHMLGELRDHREQRQCSEPDYRGPLYSKLSSLVDKLELMRWLVGRLATARGPYDWLADPRRRLEALPLTRQHNTIDLFTQ